MKAELRLHKGERRGSISVDGTQIDIDGWRKVGDTDTVAAFEFDISHDAQWQALLGRLGSKIEG